MYVLVSFFIGVAAFNSQTNLLFWIFGLMMGGLLVSGVVSGGAMMGLSVQRILPDHAAVDEPLVIRYELTNRKLLLPCFGLIVSELDGNQKHALRGRPQGFVLHVGPRARVQGEAMGFARRRGPVQFDRIEVATTFPFGILRKSIIISQPGRVVVCPKLMRLSRRKLAGICSRDVAGSQASGESGGSEEFYGLREYRPGDSIKLIDWKHSARANDLVRRELTRLTPPKLSVLLDLRNPEEPSTAAVELAISFAASLICDAHLAGFEVGLEVAGVECPSFGVHPSRMHRTRLLHALGELDLGRRCSIWSPTTLHARDVAWVVVHPGAVDPSFGPARARHVGAADVEQWRADAAPSAEPQVDPARGPRPEPVPEAVA